MCRANRSPSVKQERSVHHPQCETVGLLTSRFNFHRVQTNLFRSSGASSGPGCTVATAAQISLATTKLCSRTHRQQQWATDTSEGLRPYFRRAPKKATDENHERSYPGASRSLNLTVEIMKRHCESLSGIQVREKGHTARDTSLFLQLSFHSVAVSGHCSNGSGRDPDSPIERVHRPSFPCPWPNFRRVPKILNNAKTFGVRGRRASSSV